jgi:hypothetical protein
LASSLASDLFLFGFSASTFTPAWASSPKSFFHSSGVFSF